MSYIDIQNEVIEEYRIDLCDGSKCKDGDWSRTHAHPKLRRVCKWKQANSVQSTFTLFHEIGHIVANTGKMRRAEEEYYATLWAIWCCDKYNLTIPPKTINEYQDYIDRTKGRGVRRGGSDYDDLQLPVDHSVIPSLLEGICTIQGSVSKKTRKKSTLTNADQKILSAFGYKFDLSLLRS